MTNSKTQPPHYLHYVKLLTHSSFKNWGASYDPGQDKVKLPLLVDIPQLNRFPKIPTTLISTTKHPRTL